MENPSSEQEISREQLISLVQISSILNATQDSRLLLPLILLKARELIQAEAGSLFLLDPNEKFLYCETAISDGGEILQEYLRLELGEGIAGWVAQEKRPVLIADAYQDERFDATWDRESGFRTRSLLCVPLFLNHEVVGTLQVLNKRGGGAFSSGDQQILMTLGDIVAVALNNARLHDSLRKRIMELTLLHEFEQRVATSTNLTHLAAWLLDRCLEVMESRTGSLLLADRETGALRVLAARGLDDKIARTLVINPGEGITGHVAQTREPLLIRNIEQDPRFESINRQRYETKSLLSAPITFRDELLGVLNINNKTSGYSFNESDLNLLATLANRLGTAMRNMQLSEELDRSSEEADRARMLMDMIVPVGPPRHSAVNISVRYILVDRIGGDFYKYLHLNDGRLGVLVVDVCGHGISAALVAMMCHSVISTFDQKLLESPGTFFDELNRVLTGMLGGNFLTAFYGVIDPGRSELRYSVAGHRAPVLDQRSDNRTLTLKARGTLVGAFPNATFEERSIPFKTGDRLLVYTDGLIEKAVGGPVELLEDSVLCDLMAGGRKLGIEELTEKVMLECGRLLDRRTFEDDVTLVLLERL